MQHDRTFSLDATLSRIRTPFIFVIYAVLNQSDYLTRLRRNLVHALLAAYVFDSFSLLRNNRIVVNRACSTLSGLREG